MRIVPLSIKPLICLLLGAAAVSSCSRQQPQADRETAASNVHMLEPGSPVPDVLGSDQDGKPQRLRSYLGRILLVYFYPKDGTPGCTKEACAFRDVWQRFESQGVQILGVSRDDASSHAKFTREHRIPFPLIADTDATWTNAFGVPTLAGKSARVSFLFDRSGKLERVYPRVDPGVHAEEVLQDVRSLQTRNP